MATFSVVRRWWSRLKQACVHPKTTCAPPPVACFQHQALAALQASEEQLRTFMNYSPAAAWITDLSGRLVYESQSYAQMFKLPDCGVGRTVFDLFPAAIAQVYLANIQAVAQTGRPVHALEPGVRPDGSWGEFLVYKFPLPQPDGTAQVGGVAIDVTDQQAALSELQAAKATLQQLNQSLEARVQERTAKLQASEARLRQAQRIAGLGDWELVLPEQTVTGSEELFRLLGLPDMVTLDVATYLGSYTVASQREWSLAVQATLQSGQPFTVELQRSGPTPRWLLVRGEAAWGAQGAIAKVIGTALDITERKQLEVEQQRLNQLKDDFISAASHELRTPLASLKLATHMTELLLNQCRPLLEAHYPQQTTQLFRYVSILESQSDRELQLVNDLLEMQRLETGDFVPDWEGFDLWALLRSVLETYQGRAATRDQVFQVQVPAGVTLVSDSKLLVNIVTELLTNACKYTPPGGTITVTALPVDQSQSPTVAFSVSNTGSLIPPVEQARIFAKFYRIPGSDPWHQGGTGLGLSLVKRQAEHLGATLEVTSDSVATTFTVLLPQAPAGLSSAPVAVVRV